MSKIYIRTCDIFDNKDVNVRWKYFMSCHEKALKCGLLCACHIEDEIMTLRMSGSKWQFIKYYSVTLLKTENKLNGIKRLISIICT